MKAIEMKKEDVYFVFSSHNFSHRFPIDTAKKSISSLASAKVKKSKMFNIVVTHCTRPILWIAFNLVSLAHSLYAADASTTVAFVFSVFT